MKKLPKKHTNFQIPAGGLDDSDVDDENQFPKESRKKFVTETILLITGSEIAQRDFSRKNEVCTLFSFQIDF